MNAMKAFVTRSAILVALAAAFAAGGAAEARVRSSADSLVTGFDLERCLATRAAGFEITRVRHSGVLAFPLSGDYGGVKILPMGRRKSSARTEVGKQRTARCAKATC